MKIPVTLYAACEELLLQLQFDENGALVAGQWRGGNGGLISRETIMKADTLRRELSKYEKE